jgi:hypothetical protein
MAVLCLWFPRISRMAFFALIQLARNHDSLSR